MQRFALHVRPALVLAVALSLMLLRDSANCHAAVGCADIKVREPNFESLVKTGRLSYDPPRYMSINTAISQLLHCETVRHEGVCGPETFGIGLARVGQDTQMIVSGTLAELESVDFGAPLHSLVLCGHMHELERALFDHFRVKGTEPKYQPPVEADNDGDSSDSDNE